MNQYAHNNETRARESQKPIQARSASECFLEWHGVWIHSLALRACILDYCVICGTTFQAGAAEKSPNVDFNFVEDQGYYDLDCYGLTVIKDAPHPFTVQQVWFEKMTGAAVSFYKRTLRKED